MKFNLFYFIEKIMSVVLFASMSFFVCAQNTIDKRLLSIMGEHEAIGVSVVVVRDTSIIYSNTFGYNPDYDKPELRRPFFSEGVFWLGSISKTFIGLGIMHLVEVGKLSLDDDANNFLSFPLRNPSYPNTPITIRMLLSHHSSLNDSQYSRSFKSFFNSTTDSKYEKSFNSYKPGEKYDYCNMGYSFLGAIIENVSNERLDVFMNKIICIPLGLKASFNLLDIEPELLVRSLNYDEKKQSFVGFQSVYNYTTVQYAMTNYSLGATTGQLIPSGGMKISAIDLSRFMIMLMHKGLFQGHRILSKKSIEEMIKPQSKERNYGLGLTTYKNIIKRHSLVGMRGASHGVHNIMVYEPNENVGFVVLNNGYNTLANGGTDMNYRIIRALYKHFRNK